MVVDGQLYATWRDGRARHPAYLDDYANLLDGLLALLHVRWREADIRLDQLRQYLQLAWQWKWMSDGQYQHACRLTAELGRLVGGWLRRAREPRS